MISNENYWPMLFKATVTFSLFCLLIDMFMSIGFIWSSCCGSFHWSRKSSKFFQYAEIVSRTFRKTFSSRNWNLLQKKSGRIANGWRNHCVYKQRQFSFVLTVPHRLFPYTTVGSVNFRSWRKTYHSISPRNDATKRIQITGRYSDSPSNQRYSRSCNWFNWKRERRR